MEKEKYLEAGIIVNTHGVRGEVKINPWADSPEFLSFRIYLRNVLKLFISAARR